MRTTLAFDTDVAALIRTITHERGISFGEVVNSTLRNALSPPRSEQTRFHTPTFSMGEPSVPLDHALTAIDEL